jgi:hypothetical protein
MFIEKPDFVGFHFSPEGLSVAVKTIEKFLACAVRLCEQEPGEPFGSPQLGLYVKRWVRWLYGGVTPRKFDGAVKREWGAIPGSLGAGVVRVG